MDPARYFDRWFQSYCESERSHWLRAGMKAEFKAAAYEAFNEGVAFEKTIEDEVDLTDD